MSANFAYPIMIIIGLVSVLATIIISLRIKKNIHKYRNRRK